MKHTIHRADTRGYANHGWLEAKHTFSFAGYYDPERVHFGALRVLNDDRVAGGEGFGMHPHDNMEIVTIPLEGALEHKDSMGNSSVIRSGDVQVMSAGTGVHHSEFNHHGDREVKLLQIWVFPNEKGVKPRYDQRSFGDDAFKGKFQTVVANDVPDAMFLHQKAAFVIGEFEAGVQAEYPVRYNGNSIYAFLISGSAKVDGETLNQRDGMGIRETEILKVEAITNIKILLIEVPEEW